MAKRALTAIVDGTADDIIRRLAHDETFPAYAPELLSVDRDGDRSDWVLAFRGGVARWTQRRRVLPGRIEFTQTDGDFQDYAGHWAATDGPDGCAVEFAVQFRTSVPHLAGAVESAAGRVLTRTALAVLEGVAGPARVTKGRHFLQDLPDGSPSHALR
ncbi:SRPBCC family protein [Luedemannella helvata]|uniref:Coenzyme Q-binding protein COQ10 START domain-containing protein n=1 Tax=Luedemannella helvata TaxID=349315 RepID=A0ABN2JV71_9ACTN